MNQLIKRHIPTILSKSEHSLLSYFKEIEDNFLEHSPWHSQTPNIKEVLENNPGFPIKYFILSEIEKIGYLEQLIEDFSEDEFDDAKEEFFDLINDSNFGEIFKVKLESSDFRSASIEAKEQYLKSIEAFCARIQGVDNKKFLNFEFGETFNEFIKINNVHFPKSNPDWIIRLESAMSTLEKYAPNSFALVEELTTHIIPTDEEGIVSYSSQNIPGYSVINFEHRDFNNLLDDIVHENAHHFLNHLLNQNELIYEDDDQIFYSPWRRAFRPIRGLYHGLSTFNFGHYLFKELIENFDNKAIYSLEFMKLRYQEEYIMLSFCLTQLESKEAKSKISEKGLELVKEISTYLESEKEVFLKLKSEKEFPEIADLENHLKEIKNQYFS